MTDKKELKKLMTKVAKGEISKKEADSIINQEKVAQNKPEEAKDSTHKITKQKEVKKSHRIT